MADEHHTMWRNDNNPSAPESALNRNVMFLLWQHQNYGHLSSYWKLKPTWFMDILSRFFYALVWTTADYAASLT